MSLQLPSVSICQFIMSFNPQLVSPLLETANFQIPVSFSGETFINGVTGTYTPADDAPVIITFGAQQPTWLLVVCDKQLNVSLLTGVSDILNQLPVSKVMFISSMLPTANNYTTLNFYGGIASNNVTPMPQGVAVNYSIYWGDGTLS